MAALRTTGRLLVAVAAILLAGQAPIVAASARHGIAMHGEPAQPPGFAHFDYVNPDAPKGGTLRLGLVGSFDTLNPYTVTGAAARGLGGYVFQSLLARSLDEPFTLYPQLASGIEMPEDRSWIEFTVDERARFSDGRAVTVDDVIATWRLLRDRGRPNHRSYYKLVAEARRISETSVRFVFEPEAAREMPLIMGLMPVLPAHVYTPDSFDRIGLDPPVGSGPYVVAETERGRSLTLRRQEAWWGDALPVAVGHYNFDTISYEYFRDVGTAFEAFRKGLIDVREEDDPARWATGYDFPAARAGEIVTETLPNGAPRGMAGFAFNMRRPFFDDIRVRKALMMLFPGDWVGRAYYRDLYSRTDSFFEGSFLSAEGRPASGRERALLGPQLDGLTAEILAGELDLVTGAGEARDRQTLRGALGLLDEAGFTLREGRLQDAETGAPLSFEILVATREHERLALAYSRALERAGIVARVRSVDSAQYQRRKQTFDFDMTHHFWFSSLSPGNEQRFYWGSAAADEPGSRNYMGLRNAAVDAAIDALLAAREGEAFVAAARALDRLLVAERFVTPLFHPPGQWVAYRAGLARPDKTPIYGYALETWWQRPAASAPDP